MPPSAEISVAMVIQSFRPTVGGAERQLERLLSPLGRQGVRAAVLTRGHPAAPRRERLGACPVRRTVLAGRSGVAGAAFVAEALGRICARRRPDVVHAHGALSEGAIALGAQAVGIPALVTVLGSGPTGELERLAAKPGGALRKRLLVERLRFVALSEDMRAYLVGHGVAPERIYDVPNGVDVSLFRPPAAAEQAALRRRLGVPSSGALAVFVGRLVPGKGVDTAVRAAGAAGVPLIVVGDGPDRDRLERLAAAGRAPVRFVGLVDDVHDWLRAADVFLLPSRAEGLSNALLEAMACGLACVAAPAAGVRPLLAGDRGVVVPAGEPLLWREALETLARDHWTARRLGGAAAAHVRAGYTLDGAAARLADVYRTLAA